MLEKISNSAACISLLSTSWARNPASVPADTAVFLSRYGLFCLLKRVLFKLRLEAEKIRVHLEALSIFQESDAVVQFVFQRCVGFKPSHITPFERYQESL